MRYFFDVMSPRRCELDSFGTLFSDQDEAHKWAQLLTVVLQNASDKQELEEGRVRVRSSDGQELFSIPMRHVELDLDRAATGRGESGEDHMKSLVLKRSIMIAGRKSSVNLEEAFWKGLKEIAATWRVTLAELVSNIDSRRQHSNLSSALRLFVLDHYRTKLGVALDSPVTASEAIQVSPKADNRLRSNEPL